MTDAAVATGASAEQKENVWQSVLAKATNKSKEEGSTLIVLGERNSGKAALLKKFRSREYNARAHDFLFNYSFLNVKNVRDEQDPDDIRATMNVWETDNEDQAAGLLPKFMRSQSLSRTVYAVTIDLSEPWNAVNHLDKWLGILKKAHEEAFSQLSAEEQKTLKEKIARYTQFYVDPSVQNEENKAPEEGVIELDMSLPSINLGVPVVIIGCKADLLGSVFQKQTGVGDRFEYLAQKLRSYALEYGATLAFSSSFGHGTMIEHLQEYIYHRVYGFEFIHSAKVIGNEEDYGLWVPSGYDSLSLIQSVTPANPSWKPNAKLEDVFRNPASRAKLADKVETEIKAEDNEVFFKELMKHQKDPKRVRMKDSSSARSSSVSSKTTPAGKTSSQKRASVTTTSSSAAATGGAGAVKGAKEKAVKDFFRSLLDNSDKKGKPQVRSSAKEALQSLKEKK